MVFSFAENPALPSVFNALCYFLLNSFRTYLPWLLLQQILHILALVLKIKHCYVLFGYEMGTKYSILKKLVFSLSYKKAHMLALFVHLVEQTAILCRLVWNNGNSIRNLPTCLGLINSSISHDKFTCICFACITVSNYNCR